MLYHSYMVPTREPLSAQELNAELLRLRKARDVMKERGIRGVWTNATIVAAALDRGLDVGPDKLGRVRVSDGKIARWFFEGGSGVNHRLAAQITKNKEVISALLRAKGVRAPKNSVFSADEVDQGWAVASQILPAVVKPANGKHGDLVHVGIDSKEEFYSAFADITEKYDRVLVEELVHGVEHRFLVVDNKVVAVTQRVPANVVGNGVDTIAVLIEKKNQLRDKVKNPIHYKMSVGAVERKHLQVAGLTLSSVPKLGQTVYLRTVSNLHGGGDAIDKTDDVSAAEIEFVEAAARAIPGLRLAGFDVLLPRDGVGDGPCVLEVNSSPMLTLHSFPAFGEVRDVGRTVIDTFFPVKR